MSLCKNCGAELSAGAKFCTSCGAAAAQEAAPAEAAAAVQPVPAPAPQQKYQPQEQPGDGRAQRTAPVMSIGAYIGTILLMCIPLVGFILTIVWACGGCNNPNKANFARAYLILLAIAVVLTIVLTVLFATVFSASISELLQF